MKLKDLPDEIYLRYDGRWCKRCPSCGTTQSYLRRNYAIESYNLKKECKSCSNKKTDNCGRGLYQEINITWFNKFKTQAEIRNIFWDISIEDIWILYLKQEKLCALSGVEIGWSEVGHIHTASIDRIDSSIGYIKSNIQILHKDVNMMKQQFKQEYFLKMCENIYFNNIC